MTVNVVRKDWIRPSLAWLCTVLAVVIAPAASAWAQALATYDLTYVDDSRTAPPAVQRGVEATRYTARGPTRLTTSRTHMLRIDSGANASKVATIDAAVANDIAGEFSVTPRRGRQLNLTSLEIGMQLTRGADSESFTVHLRSSLDDYATDIATATLKGSSSKDVVNGRGSFDLSGPQFQGLQKTVTFRLYMVSDIGSRKDGSQYIRITPDVVLNGSVETVP